MTTPEIDSRFDAQQQGSAGEALHAEASAILHADQRALEQTPGNPAPLTPGSPGDHYEVPSMPGLNDNSFHEYARGLSFQADAADIIAALQPRADVSALGLPYVHFDGKQPDQPVIAAQARTVGTVMEAAPPVDTPTERPPSVDVPQERYHTVKYGDNLWKIARANLHQGASNTEIANYVNQIAAHNHMRNPNIIMPGQIIKLRDYVPVEHRTRPQTRHAPSDPRAWPDSRTGGNTTPFRGDGVPPPPPNYNDPDYTIRPQPPKPEPVKPEPAKPEPGKPEPVKPEPAKPEPVTPEPGKPEPGKPEPTKPELQTPAPPKPESKTEQQGAPDAPPPVKDQPDKPKEVVPDKPVVAEELQRLRTLAQQRVRDQQVLADIDRSALTLASTEQQKVDLFTLKDKSISPDEAHNKARAEIVETYKQAERLLLADRSTQLSSAQLQVVAAEVLHNAAHPEQIAQGTHKTCQTTAVESMLYMTEPSKASKLVADVALTGEFTAGGLNVKIDARPRDYEAMNYPPQNGERSLASQIFQNTAINLVWAKIDPTGKTHYVQVKRTPYDTFAQEALVQDDGAKGKIDPGSKNSPDLHAEDLATMHKLLTGRPDEALVVEATDKCDLKTICVPTRENLAEILEQRKKAGQLPIILYVHTGVDGPLKTESGDWHAILATDYANGKVRYYNWWGQATTNREITIGAVYTAMQGLPKKS